MTTSQPALEAVAGMSDAPLRVVKPDDLDVCRCGDYRRDHKDGTGRCIHNKPGDITHGMQDCMKFDPRHEPFP